MLVVLTVVGALAMTAVESDGIVWRARVIWFKLSGDLPELPVKDLVRWLLPRSPVYLGGLADAPNVRERIWNPLSSKDSAENGARLYSERCASCHGDNGTGSVGPNLITSFENKPDWDFFSAVKWGIPDTTMRPQPLNEHEIWEIHAYLQNFGGQDVESGGVPARRKDIRVNSADILDAENRPGEWLTYAGNYAGHRHSSLSNITKANVRRLRIAWVAQLHSTERVLKASPIVASGLLFVTEPPEGVVAFDARSGETVWRFQRHVPSDVQLCCGAVNRGVAILGDTVYVTTLDAHLVALDASTGRKKWEIEVADYREGYSMTGAPLAVDDRIIVGVAGGEWGIRGFIAAYRANDGQRLWKFDSVPGPGEFGHETWAGDSWKTGGGPTWSTGAYDADLGLVYWGVGNPSPPFSGRVRAGDNLFSNSVVALDKESGELRWYYQFTPAGEHDWDSAQQPVLTEISRQGARLPVVIWANRNAFFYALDRRTGAFLFAKPFATQTWAGGFTSEGRPIRRAGARPSYEGALVSPAVGGATNWWPPSYDPDRGLLYVPSIDGASLYFTDKRASGKLKSELWLGGWAQTTTGLKRKRRAGIKAIEAVTGNIRWETELAKGIDMPLSAFGGVLSTAGGIVFAGFDDEFFAFDSDSGKILWRLRLGGRVNAPPIAYRYDGIQYIAVMAGDTLFTFTVPADTAAD